MPESLHILIDARMVTSRVHGIGRYTCNLIRGLNSLGHQVSILSHSAETPELIGRRNLGEIISCQTPFAHPREALELSFKARRPDFDIVHFPSFSVPFFLPARSVITIHDLIHLRTGKPAHHLYYRTVVKRALTSCSRIIAVSQWTKDDLREKLGVTEEKIHVVRNGLEDKWFSPQSPGATPPESVQKPYFLCLSNPKPHKNVKTLVSACHRLWEEGVDFRLVLSLGGEDLPASWNLTSRDRHQILLLKNANDAEVLGFMAHATAVVSPSFFEGFDYPAAEGLALGKTVILSRGSAHEEIQGNRVHFYAPADNGAALAEELSKVLRNPDSTGPAPHNIGRLDSMIDGTLKVYRRVLETSATSRGETR